MLNKGSFFAGPRGPATPSPAASPSASPSSSPAASLMSSSAPPKNATEPVVVAGENRLATATTNHREVVAGARLTVAPGVKLKGAEIQDCDTLVVEGRVDATMNSRNSRGVGRSRGQHAPPHAVAIARPGQFSSGAVAVITQFD